MALKLVSVNIERSKHLHLLEPFLRAQAPDILCLQELYQPDIAFFQSLVGPHHAYAPMTRHIAERPAPTLLGTAIFSRTPLENVAIEYYKGDGLTIPDYHAFTPINIPGERPDTRTLHHALVSATVGGLRIATTHLMVTTQGESTLEQLADADHLLALATTQAQRAGGLFMCGDFNAPRGGLTFSKIVTQFTDSIPPEYTTSLDGNIHRAGPLPYMVDGLFHTPNYRAENVALHSGVSDHMAITAILSAA